MTCIISEQAAKAKAKALRTRLGALGIAIGHQQALEVVASLEGEASWGALNAKQAAPRAPSAGARPRCTVAASERIDPALEEYDYEFAVAYVLQLADGTSKTVDITPYKHLQTACCERDRVNAGTARHKTTATVMKRQSVRERLGVVAWAALSEARRNELRAADSGWAEMDGRELQSALACRGGRSAQS